MAARQLDIDANLKGIGHVLRDATLQVPPFQRNYSWTEEEVDEYWFDLRAALTADLPYYFMGTVVVSKDEDGNSVVIDGQQRLATTTLLLAAIRDALLEAGENNRSAAIQARYLTAWSLELDTNEPRLELNEADRGFFRAAVLHESGTLTEVRPLLAGAFQLLKSRVADEASAAGPHWLDRLLRWVEFLDQRAQVILMETANDGDAFMVFETLNDRGLPLAVADVIKNYFFSKARRRLDEASVLWLTAMQAIEDSATTENVTDFIRHWWNSRNGATRERDLYTFIRGSIKSEDQALHALTDMASKAPVYAALSDLEHLVWEDQLTSARLSAGILNELGLEQYRPLALAVLSKLDSPNISRILRGAVSWSVRALISGGAGGGTAERLYSEAAVRVTNGRSTSVESVFEDMSTLIARDSEFKASFATRRVHRSATLRYLLRALAQGDPLVADREHLMPVAVFPKTDASGEWQRWATADQLAEVSGRLGNFVLLERGDTKRVPSSPRERFDYLTDRASRSGALIEPWYTYELAEVDRRQKSMADAALGIWPLVPEPLAVEH